MEKIKKFIGFGLGLFLVIVCFLAIKAILLVDSITDTVNEAKSTIQETRQFIQEAKPETLSTLKSVKESTDKNASIIARPEVQRSITLLAQSGDDWARLPINLNSAINELKQSTLPRANALIDSGKNLTDQGAKTLQNADTVLLTVDEKIDKLGNIAAQDLQYLSQLLTSPELTSTLKNFSKTSSEVEEICKNLSITTEELNKSLPQLITELQDILQHLDDGTSASAAFIQGLSKPLNKKQKLYRALIQVLVIAAPVVLRR